MWRRSNDRKLRALLEGGPQQPVPDTLRARLQADIQTRFGQPRAAPGILRRAGKTIRKKPLLAVAAVLLVGLFIATPVLVLTNWETERWVWAAKTAMQLMNRSREFAITYARDLVGAATGFPLAEPLGTIADGLDHRASLLRTFEGYITTLTICGPDRPGRKRQPLVMTKFFVVDEEQDRWLAEMKWHHDPSLNTFPGMDHELWIFKDGVLVESGITSDTWNLRDPKRTVYDRLMWEKLRFVAVAAP